MYSPDATKFEITKYVEGGGVEEGVFITFIWGSRNYICLASSSSNVAIRHVTVLNDMHLVGRFSRQGGPLDNEHDPCRTTSVATKIAMRIVVEHYFGLEFQVVVTRSSQIGSNLLIYRSCYMTPTKTRCIINQRKYRYMIGLNISL